MVPVPDQVVLRWGKAIRGARKAAGLTQEELGQAVGVHMMTVSRWERGESPTPPAKQLAVAEALHQEPADLFTWDAN